MKKCIRKSCNAELPLYQHQKVYRSVHLKQLRRNRAGPP
nr:MAG TPA: hypothetical protein [Caudoviricetes sp.]